jgi:hypothetical protein
MTIALATMLVWGMYSLNFALGVQQRAVDTPSSVPLPAYGPAPVSTEVVSEQNPVSVTYPELLQKARAVCPEDRPFILLNDEEGVVQLSDYLLYPRKIEFVRSTVTFGDANLANAMGGCAANYGIDAERRLAPFRARLDRIACAAAGCLYYIR